jgi:hypothetical protein
MYAEDVAQDPEKPQVVGDVDRYLGAVELERVVGHALS